MLAEAIAEVNTEYEGDPDYEIEKVEVKDGSTGEVVASGHLFTTRGYDKYSGYEYSCWSGYTPEGSFEHIRNKQGKTVTDKTWDECIAEVKEETHKRKMSAAQRKLKEA